MTWTPQKASFPHLRHRRKRQNGWIREMVREHRLTPADFILPVFVHEEQGTMEVEVSTIQSFYGQLPDAQRAVVEQIYIHDRTHEEAAAVLNIPLGTLKSRLRLGVGKLRQMVGTEV